MARTLSLWVLSVFLTGSCLAQNMPVSGTVQDEKGIPVPAAFVEVKEEGITTLTDTLGNFRLTIKPRSTLIISASGFEGDTLRIDSRSSSLSITLKPKFQALEGVTVTNSDMKNDPLHTLVSQSAAASMGGFSGAMSSGHVYSGGGIGAFSIKEDTKGSRYLFTDEWARGTINTVNGLTINNPRMLINYDKMNRSLFITEDSRKVIEIDKDQVRSFDLRMNDQQYHFKRVRNIDSMQFFLVLREVPEKYSLYKLTKTRFVKSNYHSDGMVESGNPYDEYTDQQFYFLQPPGDQPFKLITVLKIKPLRELMNADPKASAWLSKHKYDPVDEQLLIDMVDYINQ